MKRIALTIVALLVGFQATGQPIARNAYTTNTTGNFTNNGISAFGSNAQVVITSTGVTTINSAATINASLTVNGSISGTNTISTTGQFSGSGVGLTNVPSATNAINLIGVTGIAGYAQIGNGSSTTITMLGSNGNITITGTNTAAKFVGDGSGLTNIAPAREFAGTSIFASFSSATTYYFPPNFGTGVTLLTSDLNARIRVPAGVYSNLWFELTALVPASTNFTVTVMTNGVASNLVLTWLGGPAGTSLFTNNSTDMLIVATNFTPMSFRIVTSTTSGTFGETIKAGVQY